MSQNYDRLVQTVTSIREDMEKAAAGNKAAQTRVRKAMQDVKNLAQDIRKEMLEVRDGVARIYGLTKAVAGEMLVRIEGETSRLADQKLAAQEQRASAEDLDMTEAISKFQSRQTGYDAALKSYSMVQRLSLFDYLNA